jgi:ribonuclease BN (tRNA processing enzyme)
MKARVAWTILGSGAGLPSKNRACAGHLLSIDKSLVMLDCGSGATSAYIRRNYPPENLAAIFISHLHADHVSDLPLFLQWLKLVGRNGRLPLFLPGDAIESMENYLKAAYVYGENLPFPLELIALIAGKDNQIGNAEITAIANSHQGDRAECFSFGIETDDGRRIFYSADIGGLGDIEKYLGDLELLIIEAMHVDINQLAAALENYAVKRAVLTHYPDDAFENLRAFVDMYDGKTELNLGTDGMEYPLDPA